MRRIVATTYRYNTGSRRVLEKCGLSHTSDGEIWEGDEVTGVR